MILKAKWWKCVSEFSQRSLPFQHLNCQSNTTILAVVSKINPISQKGKNHWWMQILQVHFWIILFPNMLLLCSIKDDKPFIYLRIISILSHVKNGYSINMLFSNDNCLLGPKTSNFAVFPGQLALWRFAIIALFTSWKGPTTIFTFGFCWW